MRHLFIGAMLGMFVMTACTLPTPRPTDPKTPEEQLLISQALTRSMKNAVTEIPAGTKIMLEFSGLNTDQSLEGEVSQRHVKNVVAGWLGRQGCIIAEDKGKADLWVRVIVESIGTREKIKFFGVPPIQSILLPVVTPEITLYKREARQGYIRFYLDIFEAGTGRFVRSTPPYKGLVKESRFTVLFIFDWVSSDVDDPLQPL